MGIKGDRQTSEAARVIDELLPRLDSLGSVSSKKMFGGYGLFQDGKMFGLVNSKAELFFKVDESNRALFDDAGSTQHGKMPYYSVPADVIADTEALLKWAVSSVSAAHG